MRIVRCLAAGLALAAFAGGARGTGFIERTGAVITLGVAPDQGTLTEDPCATAGPAPAVPAPTSIGTIGSPTFGPPGNPFGGPGGNTGTDGAFVGSVSQTLAGRTFDFTTFTVNAGVEITYSSGVVIRTTSDVSIQGTVTTNSPATSLVFRCAGGFHLGANARVRALGAGSEVQIGVAGSVTGAAGASVESTGEDVAVLTYALFGGTGDVTLNGTTLHAAGGNIDMQVAGAFATTGSTLLRAEAGNVFLQTFGGAVTFGPGSAARALRVTIESARGATFTDVQGTGSQLDADDGGLSVRAFGGDVEFVGESEARSAGDVLVGASANVRVAGRSQLDAGLDLTVTAFDGDVTYEPTDDFVGFLATQDLAIAALRDVVLSGVGRLSSAQTIDVRALGGGVSMTSGIGVSAAGALSILAGGEASIDLAGAKLEGSRIDVLALGSVTIGGAVDAQSGAVTVTAWFLGIDLRGASIRTHDDAGVSGDITVQSFSGTSGMIDATGTTFRTDDAATKSGDVILIVRRGATSGRFASIDAHLVPKKVTVKLDAKVPAKSKVTVSGTIDFGANAPPGAAQPATLEVGNATFPIASFVTKGRSLEHAAPGIVFRITPAKSGSSRGTFALVRTADLTGEVSRDGALRLRFAGGGIDATATVNVAAGKFALGKVRSGLIVPCIFPQSVTAVLKGSRQDSLSVVAGFELSGYAPTMDPSLTIGFGDDFTATIDRTAFVRKGTKLTFKGDVKGITDVVIDYASERITVKGRAMSLGLPPNVVSPVPIRISIALDTTALGLDTREVTVQLPKKGTKLTY